MEIRNIEYYKEFFAVSDPISTKSYRGVIDDTNGDFGLLLRGEYTPEKLKITHFEGGKEPGDIFWNHVNDPFCISEKVKMLFTNNNISGLEFVPTIVKNKNNKQNPTQYYTVIITGRVNSVDLLNSDIRFIKKNGMVKESAYFIGKKFDTKSWDSSDFFMERKDNEGKSNCCIYVTKKVVDLFKKNKLKNILFENLSGYETSWDIIKIGASDDMKRKMDEKIGSASAQQKI